MMRVYPIDTAIGWYGPSRLSKFGKTASLEGTTIKLTNFSPGRSDLDLDPRMRRMPEAYAMYTAPEREGAGPMLYVAGYTEQEAKESFFHLWNRTVMDRRTKNLQLAMPGRIICRKGERDYNAPISHVLTFKAGIPANAIGKFADKWQAHKFGQQIEQVSIRVTTNSGTFEHVLNWEEFGEWEIMNPEQYIGAYENLYCEQCRQVGTINSLSFFFVRSIGFRCGPCCDHIQDQDIPFFIERIHLR